MTQTITSPSSLPNDLDKIQEQYLQLLGSFRSVQLATVNAEGFPFVSYSPAVLDGERNFYIFISEIATHTGNLLSNGKVSFAIIEDESKTNQIFARKRITFKAQAIEIQRNTDVWEKMLENFANKHGRIVEHLKTMEDFHLLKLRPENGRLVLGFGRAYSISTDLSQVEHLNGLDGKGHRKSE